LGLGKLISVYDDNEISIDGCVEGWFQDDTPKRFEAYGWHVVRNVDGHDPEAVRRSLEEARAVTDRPSLICCKTVIGQGAPNVCGTEKCHGAPLGEEEISCARDHLGWSHGPFEIPDAVYAAWDARPAGAKAEAMWNERMAAYETDHPELAAEFRRRMAGALPDGFSTAAGGFVRKVQEGHENLATRKASQKSLEGYGPLLPELIGGSADLAGSNLTRWSGSRTVFGDTWDGNYINFGVREFAMAAMMNGLALHDGFIPYGGTFLVFADYARNAIRMAAMMGIRTIYVLTHDSIGVGEDGPTHQPVEHVASLRLIPNLHVWRPCDAVESAAAWKAALERRNGPSALVFSRQTLKHNDRDAAALQAMERGGYVLRDCPDRPQAIILATGSEVGLAVAAAEGLLSRGLRVRVVSMPCLEVFEAQDSDYRNSVLPPEVTARVAVEAGSPDPWYRYVGTRGRVVGMDRFGESAPGAVLFEYFGFTPDALSRAVEEVVQNP
ncbi:MAG: transketolase family protein, partial [Desulfohalobiaceae bacterium]